MSRRFIAAVGILVAAGPAAAVDLINGRVAKFQDKPGTSADRAVVRFSRESAITSPVPDPRCPAVTTVRVTTDTTDLGTQTLDCRLWVPVGTKGYKYVDKTGFVGGITKVLLKVTASGGRMVIAMKGNNYGANPVAIPTATAMQFAEAALSVDQTTYCGRFELPVSVERWRPPTKVRFRGPSVPCRSGSSATSTPTGPTATFTDTPTFTNTPTITLTPTPIPPPLSNVSITNNTTDIPAENTGDLNAKCWKEARSSASILGVPTGSGFNTRFAESVVADCEMTTGPSANGTTATHAAAYAIDFDVTCPVASTYQLTVNETLNGSFTTHGDLAEDFCDQDFFGGQTSSQAQFNSAVVATQTGGDCGGTCTLTDLGIPAPPGRDAISDGDTSFDNITRSTTITGTGTGSAKHVKLSFGWTASCASHDTGTKTGAECAVRLGLDSTIVQVNGVCTGGTKITADDYPSNAGSCPGCAPRTQVNDGHFISVIGICVPPAVTATPTNTNTPNFTNTPTITPGGPTLTPTWTPTVTNTAPPTWTPTNTQPVTPTYTPGALGDFAFTISSAGAPDCSTSNPGYQAACGSNANTTCFVTNTQSLVNCGSNDGAPNGKWLLSSTDSGKIYLTGGVVSGGRATVTIRQPVVEGDMKGGTAPGYTCVRFQQDPTLADSNNSFVNCTGNTRASLTYAINSNGGSAPGAGSFMTGTYPNTSWPSMTVDTASDATQPTGMMIVRVLMQTSETNSDSTSCTAINFASVAQQSVAIVTGTVKASVASPNGGGSTFPAITVGRPFVCSAGTWGTSGTLGFPEINLDVSMPTIGAHDTATAARWKGL